MGAILASLGVKLLLALTTLGTNDAVTWRWFGDLRHTFGGIEVYRRTAHDIELFNHPPFMVHVLRLQTHLGGVTGIPFAFWLRIPAIAADVAAAVLVWALLRRERPRRALVVDLAMVALAPVSVMVAGFHGNTDPVMMAFTLLSVYLLSTNRAPWLAGVALGMAMNVKVVPLIFVPALVLYLRSVRHRIIFIGAAGCAVGVGSLPYLVQDAPPIVRSVLGYGSLYGQWGVPRILHALTAVHPLPSQLYEAGGRFVALGACAAAAGWSSRIRPAPSLYRRCALSAFTFLALTPGFGVQYLAWLAPWAPAAGTAAAALFYATSDAFLFAVYTYWSGGLPWYFANSWEVGPWTLEIMYLEVACWGAVVASLRRIALRVRLPTRIDGHPGAAQL